MGEEKREGWGRVRTYKGEKKCYKKVSSFGVGHIYLLNMR